MVIGAGTAVRHWARSGGYFAKLAAHHGGQAVKTILRLLVALILLSLFSAAARADVQITFKNNGPDLEMTFTGTITGEPKLGDSLGSESFSNVSDLWIATGGDPFTRYFDLRESGSLFDGVEGGLISGAPLKGGGWKLLGLDSMLLVTFEGGGTHSLNGKLTFPNSSVDALGTPNISEWTVLDTTGGPGELEDTVRIYVATPPRVTQLTPNTGSTAGGTTVTITGTGFTGVTAVTFGGVPAASFTVDSATQITAVTPAGSAGEVDVVLTHISQGTGMKAGAFTYADGPTVALSSTARSPVTGAFPVTATFSTDVTGFTSSGVTVGNGTVSNFQAVSGSEYTFDVTPAADGNVTVDIPANVAIDGSKEGNSAAPQFSITADLPAPAVTSISPATGALAGGTSVTITGTNFIGATSVTFGGAAVASFTVDSATQITAVTPAGSAGAVDVVVAGPGGSGTGTGLFTYAAGPTVGLTSSAASPVTGAFPVTATFSTDVTGFTSSGVTAGNGTVSNFQAVSGSVYTFDVTPNADGNVTVDIPANVATDSYGQSNSAATQFAIAADITAPTATIATTAADPVTGLFTVTASFSEPVTGLALGGISVSGGTASNLTGSGSSYSFDVTPSADGTVTVQVSQAAAQDAAGNASVASNELTRTADLTDPTVTLTTPSATVSGDFVVTATFSESVTGFSLSGVSVGNGQASALSGSGTSYTFTVTPTSNGQVTVDVPAGAAQDGSGRYNAAADQLTVSYDGEAPSVTLATTAVTATGTFTVTATFSEVVSGFSLGGVSVGNGTADNLSGSGAVYSFEVTPSADGTVTVQALAGAAQDGAGNASTASNVLSVSADLTAPTAMLSGPTGNVSGPFTLTVTFSEPVSGFTSSGVTVTQATATGFTEVTPGTVYTLQLTPVMGQTVTASVPANAAQDAAGNGNMASDPYSVQAGSPRTAFDAYKDDVKRIIQDQAEKRLTTLMNDNGRMMQDARGRFIGFVSGPGGQQMGLMANGFDAIAFDVNGTADVSGGLKGIVAASSGEFLGQTGMVNGANWRLSGNFDILLDGDQSLASIDARVAREQFLTRNVLWGAFGGGQFSSSEIADSFTGSETNWQLYGGTYAVGKLTSNLFADAYASAGYGWSDLSMNNDVLALDSNYGTLTWQVGGSLTGLIEMERFSLLPTMSVAYGNSNLGQIGFTAQAYGLTDNVSMDADHVTMGVLRLTPEVRIPLGVGASSEDGVVLGLLPSFICQQVVADDSETGCGWGMGAELMQAGSSGLGQFSGKVDFEQLGGISRIGGQIGYSIQF